ncbi:MAG: LysR family transcriptional regulator substrate-binding protein, partial [Anaerolineae bacterium]|nr:LysR family transcriptional regulator substrate-binding protein [Anaerolineae bacterium]
KLYAYAVKICHLVAEAELALVHITAESEGELSIGATPNISTYRLPIWTGDFAMHYPRLRLRVQTDITAHIIRDVTLGKLDIGLIEGEIHPDHAENLQVHRLESIVHVMVVGQGHPLWGRETITFTELRQQKIIMRPVNSHSRQWLEGIFKAHGVKPAVLFETDNIEAMKRMVQTGDSIAILPDYTVADAVKNGALWALRADDVPLVRDHKVLWAKSSLPTPFAHVFLRHLGDLFGVEI